MKPARLLLKVGISLMALFIALTVSEFVVRFTGWDWPRLEKILYWQTAEVICHQVDPNPSLLYRLRPGTHSLTRPMEGVARDRENLRAMTTTTTINSSGARGPERSPIKSEKTFRILCFGGSNVYGGEVNDGETWPDRLENVLNQIKLRRFEVWNFGTSAYVAEQMAVLAQEKIMTLKPDLVLFALSNTGRKAFLGGHSAQPFFFRGPDLWMEIYTPSCKNITPFLSYNARLWLFAHSHLYRLLATPFLDNDHCRWNEIAEFRHNLPKTREFFAWAAGHTKLAIILSPAIHNNIFRPYIEKRNVPYFELQPPTDDIDYRKIHPPAYVYEWYGEEIAKWLLDQKLVY